MNRGQRIVELGSIGENIVLKFFEDQGLKGELSEDRFDSKKDMIVDGETVEVKTLVPIYKYNAFCLPVHQSPKCESVDRLIFVKIPNMPDDPIHLYESHTKKDSRRRWDFQELFNGQQCRFYRLTFLENLGTIEDKSVSKQMWTLSPSTFKGRKNYVTTT